MRQKETKNAEQMFCTVVARGGLIVLRYIYNDVAMYIEMPLTENNAHLKEGDEMEMTLLIKTEEPK